eukprot:TRINITY_DN2511_c0_g2_i1.p1 TRINITY_DN2511_c0_g2~~TRINITY_DN2511_c0_g2_i1.p1  ORF type:complete len:291 (-),score=11.58 TRINITY_DN2511_c0_g2_i1:166-993(-)
MSRVSLNNKAVLSFTGGKDCTLCLHLIHNQCNEFTNNEQVEVVLLVTFVPAHTTNPFRAHPLPLIKQAAKSLGIEHRTILVGPPYVDSYREKIRELKQELNVKYFVTGDVEDVCDQFTKRAVTGTGVELLTPLWQRPRDQLLSLLWSNQIQSIITCVNLQSFGMSKDQLENIAQVFNYDGDDNYGHATRDKLKGLSASEQQVISLVGRVFDDKLCKEIQEKKYSVDRVGEYGEFHTMVTDSKLFSQNIEVDIDSQGLQRRIFNDVYSYIEFPDIS